MTRTTVVINRRWSKASRDKMAHGRPITYIGRPSLFGNPHRVTKYFSQESAVEAYRETFHARIKADYVFRKEVEKLRGRALECFCAPKVCHGDVIAEYLNELESREDDQQEH